MFNDKGKAFEPFEKKIYLSSPTMHGPEMEYMKEAFETNWMSTVGENINVIEKDVAELCGVKEAAALSSGTSALHMAVKLAGVKRGERVFCSDMTFAATVNPIVYEGGVPVFIDTDPLTWNMDPAALKKAFELYPEVRVVMVAHLYGVPARMDEIREICDAHKAIIIEDAAEAMGAVYRGRPCGSLGLFNVVSFNGNKIITGSTGGMLLTDMKQAADKVRKWSTQSRENTPWYQHKQIGYNYRMSNVVAGVVRGQLPFLKEHIAQKKAIYERYREGFADLPVKMNPYMPDGGETEPSFWLSCMTIDREAMSVQVLGETNCFYKKEAKKTCPTEILEALGKINAEGRPIWKPMHLQPVFVEEGFVTRLGNGREGGNIRINSRTVMEDGHAWDVGADVFERGLCLPSDNKITPEQQDRIIAVVRACFE